MRILYLITKSNWGGAQRQVFDLAVEMKSRGHEVAVALGGEGILRQKLESAGIYTHSIVKMGRDISVGRDAGSLAEIFSIIRHRRPDVLHLHSPKAAGLGSLCGRLLGVKKIVYTVHGWSFNESRPIHQRLAILFFSWLTMIFVHKIILISKRDLEQARKFPFSSGKLAYVPNGIKSPTFVSVDGAKQVIARKIGLSVAELSKKTLICTNAELHPNKGLTYLIEAMTIVAEQFPNAVSVIVSDGQQKAELERMIKEKKLEKNVYLAGYVDQASEYLKAFTVFVLPSIKEGLPYVIFESAFASLPVVSTPVGGIPDLIEDMKSGILVQPRNSRELAHAIAFMIEHPEERRKYAAALRDRITSQFSIEKMFGSIEGLYLNK